MQFFLSSRWSRFKANVKIVSYFVKLKESNSFGVVCLQSYRGQSMLGPQRRRSALSTYVLHSTIVAHQEFSLALLDWLSTIVRQSGNYYEALSGFVTEQCNQKVFQVLSALF